MGGCCQTALIEISVYTDGEINIEIRTSIEALLTGINGRYKNTTEAPNADEYDRLRELSPEELEKAFNPFKKEFLEALDLKLDDESIKLDYAKVDIAERGYTKVPRTSVIILRAKAGRGYQQLRWYYPLRFGDHATRVRQVDAVNEHYHWSSHQWIKKDEYTQPYSLQQLFTRPPCIRSLLIIYIQAFCTLFRSGWIISCLFSGCFFSVVSSRIYSGRSRCLPWLTQ